MCGGTFSRPNRLACRLSLPDNALILFLTGYLDSEPSGLPVLGWDVGRSPERDTPRISIFSGLLIRDRGCWICGKLTPILPVLSWEGGLTPTCDILVLLFRLTLQSIQLSQKRKRTVAFPMPCKRPYKIKHLVSNGNVCAVTQRADTLPYMVFIQVYLLPLSFLFSGYWKQLNHRWS